MGAEGYKLLSLDQKSRILEIRQKLIGASVLDLDSYNTQSSKYMKLLVPLLVFLGWKGDVEYICEVLPENTSDLNLIDFKNILLKLGYKTHNTSIDLKDLEVRLCPCLFIENDELDDKSDHVKVNIILEKEGDELVCFDSYDEKFYYIPHDEKIIGQLFCFSKIDINKDVYGVFETIEDSKEKPEQYKKTFKAWFFSIFLRFKKLSVLLLILSAIINFIHVCLPIFILFGYGQVRENNYKDTILYLGIGAMFLILLEMILQYHRFKIFTWIKVRIDYILTSKLFEQTLLLPPAIVNQFNMFKLFSIIKNYGLIRNIEFSHRIFDLPFIVFFLIAIYLIIPQFFFICMVVIILIFYLGIKTYKQSKDFVSDDVTLNSHKDNFLLESLNKIEFIRGSGAHNIWWNRLRKFSGKIALRKYDFSLVLRKSLMVGKLFLYSSIVFAFIYGALFLKIEIIKIFVAILLMHLCLSKILLLFQSIENFNRNKIYIKYIYRVLEIPTETTPILADKKIPNLRGKIELSNISIKFKSSAYPVFSNISFKIEFGELISIYGKSGIGKTVLLNLIQGYYKPNAGVITLDNINIDQIDKVELRRSISYISSQSEILMGTIAHNLRIANPLATEQEMINVLDEVGLLAEISELPRNLHYEINYENSYKFSEIFIFKLSMARSLIKDSNIILIDELPSHILNNCFDNYKNLLLNYKGKKTIIAVLDRKELIDLTDRIIYIMPSKEVAIGQTKRLAEMLFRTTNKSKANIH